MRMTRDQRLRPSAQLYGPTAVFVRGCLHTLPPWLRDAVIISCMAGKAGDIYHLALPRESVNSCPSQD